MSEDSKKQLPDAIEDERGVLARREGEGLPVARTAVVHVTPEQLALLDKIEVRGLEVFANHGVYPEENKLGQKFVVSLTLYVDLARAGETDDLSASIDYGRVCHMVSACLRERTYHLIEAAAERVARCLLEAFPQLVGVRVKLEKPWAPVGLPLESVGVEIVRIR